MEKSRSILDYTHIFWIFGTYIIRNLSFHHHFSLDATRTSLKAARVGEPWAPWMGTDT